MLSRGGNRHTRIRKARLNFVLQNFGGLVWALVAAGRPTVWLLAHGTHLLSSSCIAPHSGSSHACTNACSRLPSRALTILSSARIVKGGTFLDCSRSRLSFP